MKNPNSSSLLVAATVMLLSSVSHATLCSSEVAIPLPSEPEVDCNGDADCLATNAQANCIAINAVSDTPRDCSSGGSSHISASGYIKRQAGTLNCAATELCFLFIAPAETSLLCLDAATGDYHDESGGKGNVKSGVYTDADGSVTTATGTPTSTPGSSVSSVGGQTTPTSPVAPGASVTDDEVTSIISAEDAEATRSVSGSGGVAQSSTTATASRSSSSAAQSSGIAEQNVGAMTNKFAKGVLGLVAGVPLLVAVL